MKFIYILTIQDAIELESGKSKDLTFNFSSLKKAVNFADGVYNLSPRIGELKEFKTENCLGILYLHAADISAKVPAYIMKEILH